MTIYINESPRIQWNLLQTERKSELIVTLRELMWKDHQNILLST